jgi:hypothetical protein
VKQLELNHYEKLLNEVMTEYLASCPDPYDPAELDKYIKQRDEEPRPIPLTWFDVAAASALIMHHKDLKDQYEIHPCTVELISMLFRIANAKLGWLDTHDANELSSYLSYDAMMKNNYMWRLHDFVFCITRFPYDPEKCKWYVYLMPLLACVQKRNFKKPSYITRYMLHAINKFGLTSSKGDHQRDLDTDFLRCMTILTPLMRNCREYGPSDPITRYIFYRDVLSEYATIFLGCLLQRSAVIEDIGTLGKEVIAQHYIEYQLLERTYIRRRQESETE